MRYFSMFSGVEGFGQGLSEEWEAVGFSEIDKYASMVLRYHYPKVKNYGDCTKIKWGKVPDFDLLTGGSPCQDFSIAGKRRGLAGARSSLAWEYIRCLRDKQPRYFLWENVKGVMSSRGGWDFANLLVAFSESGYALWWQVLNAKDFGVPQNRERIFICGFREGSPKEVFFEPKDSGQIEIMGTTKGEENTRIGERDNVYGIEGLGGALNATNYKQPLQILLVKAIKVNENNPERNGNTSPISFTLKANSARHIMVMNKGESQHYRLYDEKGLSPTLQSQSGMSSQKHPFVVAQRGRNPQNPKSGKSGLKTEQMLEANLTGNSNTLTGVEKDNYVFDGQVRKLMPIECERLMSWPRNWTQFGIDEKGNKVEISDSQRYKMCGNGVVSSVVREIVKNLLSSTPSPML